jgi:hypothetical protein
MAGSFRSIMIGAVVALASAAALAAVRDGVTAPLPVELARAKGFGEHPHMEEAQHFLVMAREELRHADSDFGGHRGQAIALVTQAMEEIERGYEYGGGAHEGPLPPQ